MDVAHLAVTLAWRFIDTGVSGTRDTDTGASYVNVLILIVHWSCKRLPPEVVLANCGSMAGQMLLSSAVCHNYMIL